jgi:hypothetical protein
VCDIIRIKSLLVVILRLDCEAECGKAMCTILFENKWSHEQTEFCHSIYHKGVNPRAYWNKPNIQMSTVVKYEINKDIKWIEGFLFPFLQHNILLHQCSNGFKTFLEILWNDFVVCAVWPDIRFSVSGSRPDIWQVKSGIRPEGTGTGYKKGWIIRPAGYQLPYWNKKC